VGVRELLGWVLGVLKALRLAYVRKPDVLSQNRRFFSSFVFRCRLDAAPSVWQHERRGVEFGW
jgi:hypothetical protein